MQCFFCYFYGRTYLVGKPGLLKNSNRVLNNIPDDQIGKLEVQLARTKGKNCGDFGNAQKDFEIFYTKHISKYSDKQPWG